jgi:FKBP-type peptidyl-prolyl cis-trans isomerase SlyD
MLNFIKKLTGKGQESKDHGHQHAHGGGCCGGMKKVEEPKKMEGGCCGGGAHHHDHGHDHKTH